MPKQKKVTKATKAIKTVKPSKKAKLTTVHHLFLLDNSGSMEAVRDVTRTGFNEQVQVIRKAEKEGKQKQVVSFYTFNDLVTEHFANVESSKLKELKSEDYIPYGSTSLNDAIGIAVNRLRTTLSDRQDTAVIVTIFTDGQENSSRDYDTPRIAALLKEVQEKNKWVVTYIGANQDVHFAARSYNLSPSNCISYTSTSAGTASVMNKMTTSRTAYLGKLANYADSGITLCDATYDNAKMFSEDEVVLQVNEDGSENVLGTK